MKKIIILSISLVFAVGSLRAQESATPTKGKDFSEMLPKAGDFALGMDMANFITTFNNSITNAGTGNATQAFQSDVFGRYFLANQNSVRFRLGFDLNNSTNRTFVRDDAANLLDPLAGNNPITELKTVDELKTKMTTTELGIGYEFRRSLRRVQGYAGGELFLGFTQNKKTYEYGNLMTAANQTPTTAPSMLAGTAYGYRFLESVGGNTFTVGAAAIVGADFFISRNVSIGAEFVFEGRHNRTSERSMLTETWLLNEVYNAEILEKPVTTSFTVTPTARLSLCVYF